MKKALALWLLAVLAGTAMFVPAVAGAGTKAKTTVTIEGPEGDFQGEIESSKKRCLGNRLVWVYKQAGKEQSPSSDEKIASDTSERDGDHGEWSVGNTGFKNGKFYARAKGTPNCRAGTSETIKI